MARSDEREPDAPWIRVFAALGVLTACVVALGLASGLGAPPPAAASPDATTIPVPLTTKPPATTSPSTSTRPTTPRTTIVTRSTVPATIAPPVIIGSRPGGSVAPAPTYSRVPVSTASVPASTTTSTTLPSIAGQVQQPVATVPLATRASNGHVDPMLAWLSGIGFAVAALIVGWRLMVTRPGGLDRAPLDGR